MKTLFRVKRNPRFQIPSYDKLEQQVLSHQSLREGISILEAADLLKNRDIYTFILSRGYDRYHYILSYVSEKQVVKHKNIRIVPTDIGPCFLNGGSGGPCASIDELIPACLKISSSVCKPLA